MRTMYLIFARRDDSLLDEVGNALGHSPEGALRRWMEQQAARQHGPSYVVVPERSVHRLSVEEHVQTTIRVTEEEQ